MENKSLLASWRRAETFLVEASKLLPVSSAHDWKDGLRQFHEFLSHSEFELALDILGLMFEQTEAVISSQAWKLMAQAAENMELSDKQSHYEALLRKSEIG